MKPYTPYIVVALVVIAGIAASIVGARQFQPAQAQLNSKLAAHIQNAASLLAAYDARDALLAEPPQVQDTQPAEVENPEHVDRLKQHSGMISDALKEMEEAVAEREESGDQTVSGDTNAAAVRLLTTLYIAQTDVFRREAGLHVARAESARRALADLQGRWMEIDTLARSAARDLTGQVPAGVEAGSRPAAAETAPADEKPAQEVAKAPARPEGPHRPGALGKLFARLGNRPVKPNDEAAAPSEPAPAQPVAEQTPEAQQAPAGPAPIIYEKLPTIAERIAQLNQQRQDAVAAIAADKPKVEKLTAEIAGLEAQFTAAKSKADDARKQMLALEKAGVDHADPKALDRFTKAYEQASNTFRENDREASLLEHGGIRNARPGTDDEEKVLTAPLAPVDKSAEMTPIRGLDALRRDLAGVNTLIETRQKLIEQIDVETRDLDSRQKEVTQQIAKLEALRADLTKKAVEVVRTALAEVVAADGLETQAISLATDKGMQWAKKASQVAGQTANDIRSFYTANLPQSPQPQVNFMTGHAQTLQGDVQYQLALVQAQRSGAMAAHAQLLQSARQMAIDVQKLLPEGTAPANVPAWVIQADASAASAKEARAEAKKAAEAAIDTYKGAAEALSQLWVVHTQMGAVHHFLSLVASTPAEAQKERDAARREYEASIKDRRDRPEAQVYRRIIDNLSASSQK